MFFVTCQVSGSLLALARQGKCFPCLPKSSAPKSFTNLLCDLLGMTLLLGTHFFFCIRKLINHLTFCQILKYTNSTLHKARITTVAHNKYSNWYYYTLLNLLGKMELYCTFQLQPLLSIFLMTFHGSLRNRKSILLLKSL